MVSLVGYGLLSFSILMLNYVSVFHIDLWWMLLSEDGVVESLSAGFFFMSSIGLVILAFVNRDTWRWQVFLFAGLVMAFVAGEEISWGQRIFGFETPDLFETANYQGEANLHNLLLDRGDRIQVVLVFVCVCVIFSARFSNKVKWFDIPYPSMSLAFGLLIALYLRDWLLPGTLADILIGIISKYGLLIFLLAYISFSSLGKDRKLILILCATIALILSSEYAGYVQVYATHTDGLYPRPFINVEIHEPFVNVEIREYILSLICLFYSVELLRHSRKQRSLNDQYLIGRDTREERRGWLLVCSVVTVCSIGLIPAGQIYTAYIKDAVMDRFYSEVAPNDPADRSVFDVYAMEDQLTYYKQPCALINIENNFFLQVIPVEVQDLPEYRQPLDSIILHFSILGVIGDSCIKIVDLPDYEISSVRTGQFTDEERVWTVEIPFPLDVDRE